MCQKRISKRDFEKKCSGLIDTVTDLLIAIYRHHIEDFGAQTTYIGLKKIAQKFKNENFSASIKPKQKIGYQVVLLILKWEEKFKYKKSKENTAGRGL